MKIYSEDEFKKKYGQSATSFFKGTEQAPKYFNTQSAKDVFTQASEDVALASGDNPANPADGGMTLAIQGGLAPFRAVGAGLMGTETGQELGTKAVEGLTEFGDAITPDVAQKYIGDIAMKTIEGYQNMTPEEQLKQRNRLGVAEFLSYFVGGSALKDAPGIKLPKPDLETPSVKSVVQVADDAVAQGRQLRENVQSYVGSKTVEPSLVPSATRLIDSPDGRSILDKYDDYLRMSSNPDIKGDEALELVGESIGDSFDAVIKQRQAVGKVLGDELKEIGKLKVSVEKSAQNLLEELADSGLSYNPKTRQFTSFQGTKFTTEEIAQLTEFFSRYSLLGRAPTVRAIDDFVSKTRSSLAFTKGSTGVLGTTNAERIINGGLSGLRNSIDPDVNGIQQLAPYWKANQTYSQLSNFIEEGGKHLGKVTQAGDYAKDASIAKSSVQSMLNNGKKDWLLKLEELTGYPALDESVLALQAMKDAGSYKGLSLLEKVRDSGVPTSKAGVTGAIIDKAFEVGGRVIAGEPSAQTRAYLKTLSKNAKPVTKKLDLKVPDKAIKANPKVPKNKKVKDLEAKIAKNVADQKKAIQAGKTQVVAKLKEAYQKLVTALKNEVKLIRANIKNQSGHANFTGGKGRKKYNQEVKLPKKLSDEQVDETIDALMNYDATGMTFKKDSPMFSGGQGDMLNLADPDARLLELQNKNRNRPISKAEVAEVRTLMEEMGVTKWTGTTASKKSTAKNTSTDKKPTDKEVKSKQSANTSGGTIGSNNPPIKQFGKPSKDYPSDPTFAYHNTNPKNLDSIIKSGIKGGNYGDVYYAPSELGAKGYGGKKPITLRVKRDNIGDYYEAYGENGASSMGEIKANKPIPPEHIEILKDGKWKPLVEDALSVEAKKYDSADEFVKAQGTPVYHSGSFSGEIDFNKTNFGDAFFVSDNKSYASGYGGKDAKTTEMVLSPHATLLDTTDPKQLGIVREIKKIIEGTPTGKTQKIQKPDGSFIELETTPEDAVSFYPYSNKKVIEGLEQGNPVFWEHPEIQKILKDYEFDGLITQESKLGKNIAVFNPDALQTRTQLEDIWKEANP